MQLRRSNLYWGSKPQIEKRTAIVLEAQLKERSLKHLYRNVLRVCFNDTLEVVQISPVATIWKEKVPLEELLTHTSPAVRACAAEWRRYDE